MHHPSDTQDNVRRAALNMLARRDYTQHEIKRKLAIKGYSTRCIEEIIAEFVQTGLINDVRFAENYLYSRRARGYGPTRISIELQSCGVADDVIAELIRITDNAWFDEVRKVWQKHFRGKSPIDYKDRAKQMRFLQYRGFTREQIRSVLSNFDEDLLL